MLFASLLEARNCEQQLLLEQILTQTAIQGAAHIKRVTNNAEHIVTHATMLLTTTTSQGLDIKPSTSRSPCCVLLALSWNTAGGGDSIYGVVKCLSSSCAQK